MVNISQPFINYFKEKRSLGILNNATVELHFNGNSFYLGIDSSEIIYQVKYETEDEDLAFALELVATFIKEKKVDDIFGISKMQLKYLLKDEKECLEFLQHNGVTMDKALSFVRKSLLDYWGVLAIPSEVEDIICRCQGIGKEQIIKTYYAVQSDAKKVFMETNISGVCGSCKSDVNKILSQLELSEKELFGKNKDQWQKQIDELINEYYLVCPPEFSKLKFEFISITPRNIKLKCIRLGENPARLVIKDSLNNFFKGQLERDIPISIVI